MDGGPLLGPLGNLDEAAANLKAAADTFQQSLQSLPTILDKLEDIAVTLRATADDLRYIVDKVWK